MFELLPDDIRKVAQKRYIASLVTLYMFGISLVFIGSSALLAPTYTYVSFKERGVEIEKQAFDRNVEGVETNGTTAFINGAKSKISVIQEASQTKPSLTALNMVLDRVSSGIRIISLSFERNIADKKSRMIVQGSADTRDNLISFSDVLKKETNFTKVDVPVSSFAKSVKADFVITIEGNF